MNAAAHAMHAAVHATKQQTPSTQNVLSHAEPTVHGDPVGRGAPLELLDVEAPENEAVLADDEVLPPIDVPDAVVVSPPAPLWPPIAPDVVAGVLAPAPLDTACPPAPAAEVVSYAGRAHATASDVPVTSATIGGGMRRSSIDLRVSRGARKGAEFQYIPVLVWARKSCGSPRARGFRELVPAAGAHRKTPQP